MSSVARGAGDSVNLIINVWLRVQNSIEQGIRFSASVHFEDALDHLSAIENPTFR